MPPNPPALVISALALLVSVTTAWLTLFRRGTLRMTQPALIGFLYDLPNADPKLFFRAVLYATGRRGYIVEGMYLKVRRGETAQDFSFWMYGETKSLMIGSGLRVGEEGMAFNHHFLPPKPTAFDFVAGEYEIEVHARIVNRREPLLLSRLKITLTQEQASVLSDKSKGVIFTWGPDSGCYRGSVSAAPLTATPGRSLTLMVRFQPAF
jgi:hypothetical protein